MSILASSSYSSASTSSADPLSIFFGLFFTMLFIALIVKIVEAISKASSKPRNYTPRTSYPRDNYSRNNYPARGRKLTPVYYPSALDVAEFNPEGERVFGTPGKSLLSSDLPETSIASGVAGEKKTAAIIDNFAYNSTNCYVFHSLRWPMSSTDADVDHVIVCGNNVLLLDSKNWKRRGHFAFNWEGDITVNDEYYRYGKKPKIFSARDKYDDYSNQFMPFGGNIRVGTTIVIHSQGSTVSTKPYTSFNRLTSGVDLEKFLHSWELNLGIVEDNKKLLCAIHSFVK